MKQTRPGLYAIGAYASPWRNTLDAYSYHRCWLLSPASISGLWLRCGLPKPGWACAWLSPAEHVFSKSRRETRIPMHVICQVYQYNTTLQRRANKPHCSLFYTALICKFLPWCSHLHFLSQTNVHSVVSVSAGGCCWQFITNGNTCSSIMQYQLYF